jgi:hypothetical protein
MMDAAFIFSVVLWSEGEIIHFQTLCVGKTTILVPEGADRRCQVDPGLAREYVGSQAIRCAAGE